MEGNSVSGWNNGDGVPVEVHQEEKVYVPELIFRHLLTSSNYGDSVKKTTGGRNGLVIHATYDLYGNSIHERARCLATPNCPHLAWSLDSSSIFMFLKAITVTLLFFSAMIITVSGASCGCCPIVRPLLRLIWVARFMTTWWAPQMQVLKHDSVGGFWSYCGWNSTPESVCEGLPMICRPFFGDQFVNTMYITRVWKIGLELEKNEFERGNITECIRKLQVEKDGQEMRDRAALLKAKVMASLKKGSSQKYLDQLADLISSA
ncbi:hypothetical protein Droror1_Dr00020586 [Drosera rotundifolia]